MAFVALAAGPAAAAELTISVRTPDGRPVQDAVITLKPAGASSAAPIRFNWAYTVNQQNIAFNPYVLIVPVGSDVSFPNKDNVRHHVYSFSPVKKFELKLYGRQEERTVHFDKAGVVPLGCNIHDQMIGYVYVVDTPYATKTGPDGTVTIRNLPGGAAAMTVWHPLMKTARNQVVKQVAYAASGAREMVTVDLRAAGGAHKH